MSADKDYLALPLRDFLADIAAKSPTPGGGSVAAAVGALGVALARMALAYTVDKAGQAGAERLRAIMDEFLHAGGQFTQLMAEDMAAYEQFAATRKGSDDQKQQALLRAIAVPMEIIVLAGAFAGRLDEIKAVVNRHLLPDLQAAAILASAAARAASTSAGVNIAALANRREAERLENQLDLLLGRLARHRNAVVHYEHP
ncbi:MAG TPA: cyclodeaminase/cyclohydrolase family protein [Phycisphaerae bacterium]|nr:cyclodeaminase/cyclohydrolase family protein [Phycisphaerae bacterium]